MTDLNSSRPSTLRRWSTRGAVAGLGIVAGAVAPAASAAPAASTTPPGATSSGDGTRRVPGSQFSASCQSGVTGRWSTPLLLRWRRYSFFCRSRTRRPV